ncbi:hypothetical protein KEJ19_04620 [Candidatus Bathyarchaeota archaeon]|nr:hypothetical protein [Candidatus Bathyarchaeota archaeon]
MTLNRGHLIVALALTCLSLLTTPHLDSVQALPLFYATNLNPVYWISVAFLTLLILKSKGTHASLYACLLFLIVYWTPNLMFQHLCFPEMYGRLSSGLLASRLGRLEMTGMYAVRPALFLEGAILLSITGIDPESLGKLYEALLMPIIAIYLLMISRKVKGEEWHLAPLLFASTFFLNELYFNNQSYAIPIYLVTLWCLTRVNEGKTCVSSLIMFFIAFLSLVITHEGNPLVLLLQMLITLIFTTILMRGNSSWSPRLLMSLLMIWLSWHAIYQYPWSNAIQVTKKIGENVYRSLLVEHGVYPRIRQQFTEVYGYIITVRIINSFLMFFSGVALIMLTFVESRCKLERQELFVISQFLASSIITAILSHGGYIIGRGLLYSSLSWSVLVPVLLSGKTMKVTHAKVLKRFIAGFSISFILLIPILKYSPIPLTYTNSKALAQLTFVFTNSPYGLYFGITDYNVPHIPCTLGRTIIEFDNFYDAYVYHIKNDKIGIIIDGHILMRDAFFTYEGIPYKVLVGRLQESLIREYNKVYSTDKNYCTFVPRSR